MFILVAIDWMKIVDIIIRYFSSLTYRLNGKVSGVHNLWGYVWNFIISKLNSSSLWNIHSLNLQLQQLLDQNYLSLTWIIHSKFIWSRNIDSIHCVCIKHSSRQRALENLITKSYPRIIGFCYHNTHMTFNSIHGIEWWTSFDWFVDIVYSLKAKICGRNEFQILDLVMLGFM